MPKAITNGDLLWRRTENSPFGNHFGVAVFIGGNLHVMHRQRHNDSVLQPFEQFLLGYQLRGKKSTRLTGQPTDVLLARFDRMKSQPFHIIDNNCETWVYRYINQWPSITHTDKRVILGVATFGVLLAILTKL